MSASVSAARVVAALVSSWRSRTSTLRNARCRAPPSTRTSAATCGSSTRPRRRASMRKRKSASRRPALQRSRSRSPSTAAISSASRCRPSSAPRTIMCARRGCVPSRASARPCAVIRPSASIASSERNRSRACENVAVGGGSSQRSVRGSLTPHSARSSATGARSASRISGAVCAGKRSVLGFRPQPVAHARTETSRAPASLIGGRARDAHRLQAAHSRRRIEARAAREPGIDDDAHALDRQTGFGDVGREHDLAVLRVAGAQRCVLLCRQTDRRTAAARARRAADRLLRAAAARGGFPLVPARTRGCRRAPVRVLARSVRAVRVAMSISRWPRFATPAARPARLDFERFSFRGYDRRIAEQLRDSASRRASPTSRGCAGPRALPSALPGTAPGRDRH